jgi:hypothetical protein
MYIGQCNKPLFERALLLGCSQGVIRVASKDIHW